MTRVRQSILGGATLAMIAGLGALLYSRPLAAQSAPASASPITFTTLPGFTIERVVPPAKTDSYVVMTFDSLGRLVVSKEQDHPRLLLDADGDGIYESEKVISDKVKNCQGLWFDGRTLYGDCAPAVPPAGTPASGPNSQVSGLYKMADTNGDDVADTFEQLSGYVGGIQEHGPHAIRRGPDGEMTVMTGNNTFVPDEKIDPMSPLRGSKESQFLPALPDGRGFGPSVKEGLHGVISRFDRQTGLFSLQVGGLRNAYDHAFNLDGELFTFDSDMEWDINLPWYRDVRSVHGIPGGNYGYRNGSGKFPAYYIDSLPPVRDLGRGSPVGVEFYQHTVYPAQFHDAYFEADWSRGRLLWTPLKRTGATYAAVEEKAEFVHGEPLNITDVETGPDGLIYFTTGGRGTEGGVYRVRYGAGGGAATGATKPIGVRPPATALEAARQPHPLSSWGYAALEQAKTAMGNAWGTDLEKLARDGAAKPEDRAQAIYLLQRHGPKPNAALLKALTADSQAGVRAAAVFVVGLHGSDNAKAIAAAALKDSDPFVQRRAAEAVVRMGLAADKPSFAPVADIFALLNSPDRFVRWAGRLALTRTPRAEWRDLAQQETNPLGAIEGMVALIDTASSDADVDPVVKKQLSMLAQTTLSVDDRLRLLRAFELSAIALKTPSAALRKQVHDLTIAQFPAQDERVNRQLALVLAWAGQPAAIAKILAAMPKGDDRPQLQLHYVYALRTMQTGWTASQKTQLIDWYAKAASWRGGASFPGFINLLFDASLQTFTDAQKKLAYQKVPQFAPLTEAELAEAAKRTAAMRAAAAQAQAQAAPQGGSGNQAANANRPATPPPAQAGPPRPGQSPANARARGVAAISREEILQEQIFTPLRTPPSLTVGRATYDRACGACHRFGGIGTDLGPDLTTLNSRFQKKDVLEAILWPSRVISEQYEMTMVETKDGKAYGGFVVQEDAQKVILRTADAVGRRIELPVAQIKSRQKSPVSLMPEALIDDMSQQEIASLMAFLQANPPQQ